MNNDFDMLEDEPTTFNMRAKKCDIKCSTCDNYGAKICSTIVCATCGLRMSYCPRHPYIYKSTYTTLSEYVYFILNLLRL